MKPKRVIVGCVLFSIVLINAYNSRSYCELEGLEHRYKIPKKLVRKPRGSLYGPVQKGESSPKTLTVKVPWDYFKESKNDRLLISISYDQDYSLDGGLAAQIKRGRAMYPYKKIKEEFGYFIYQWGLPSYYRYFTFDIDSKYKPSKEDFVVHVTTYQRRKLDLEVPPHMSCKLHFIKDSFNIYASILQPSLNGTDPMKCDIKSFKDVKSTVDSYFLKWKV